MNGIALYNALTRIDETLIAIAVNAAEDEYARKALEVIPQLHGCEMHLTVIPTTIEMETLRKLKLNFTCEPKYQTKKLYHG